jgi:glycosyltransferase involved in cell wall biosynthesis
VDIHSQDKTALMNNQRGVLYVVWGGIEQTLQRSIASVRAIHPELQIHIERLQGEGLHQKSKMGSLTPFETTLYLDADTVILGNLDFAFEKAEQFGLACCICEAPWLKRYGANEGDRIEYNTGVLLFTQRAALVFSEWARLAGPESPATSRWTTSDNLPRGLLYDDQASFARAVEACKFNPFILPLNYNVRPTFHRSFFAPIKIWHDYSDVPSELLQLNDACERNERPITYLSLDAPLQIAHKAVVSIITPTNSLERLREAYISLATQTFTDWEWIVVANGELTEGSLPEFLDDHRVKKFTAPSETSENVGALKRFACELATGAYLVELDHDDLLLPGALLRIKEAFDSNPDVGMVYSNRAAVKEDWSPYYFGRGFGWEYRPVSAMGRELVETVIPEPYPANLSRIWYAPDHVRAWRASIYHELGGHDANLELTDDHDLSCRFYLGSRLLHLDECLYIYRVHAQNNWQQNADKIQELMWRNHDRYLVPMFVRWATENKLLKIDLGCGQPDLAGFLSVDSHDSSIDSDLSARWPFGDNSVGVLRSQGGQIASLPDPIHTMNEAWRILAHGGLFAIEVPSTDGRGAFQDPTHRSFWNENSFSYWSNAASQKYIRTAGARARFQTLRLRTYFPSEWHQSQNISYVQAHLIALKDDLPRFHGAVQI